MSELKGSIDSLERQLKDFKMEQCPTLQKKIPPPPPPKKNRAQPQVLHNFVSERQMNEPDYLDSKPFNNNNNYTNFPLPPPPPPPPHMYTNAANLSPTQSVYYHYDHFNNHNDSDLLPPPSPVSSNYSELARATRPYQELASNCPPYQNCNYGLPTSTYESIYEPIELNVPAVPTPPKSYGKHDNVCLQSDTSTSQKAHSPYRNGAGDRRPLAKEEEVDALTQLLVQSISEGSEPDYYGVCVRCQCTVKGEDAGCTAMDQIYHVACFTCARCDVSLQGEPFYAVDGQPHCEQDYLHTLERCSVCEKPIRDRILRATGKPYHPACFICVACGKSLDGIPFTVDAANNIHCIEDFHAKFAPRCCVCGYPIMPEEGQEETVRVVALDRSFHVKCYRCEDCGLLLSSEAEGRGCYPLDDHILCKSCNAERIRNLSNVITTDL